MIMTGRPCLALLAVVCAASSFACTAEITGRMGRASADQGNAGSAGTAGTTSTEACETSELPRRVRLRSELQFVNALTAQFGKDSLSKATGLPDGRARTLDLDLVGTMDAKTLASNFDLVELVGETAKNVACPTGLTGAACADALARSSIERSFRRAATPEELTELAQVYATAASTSHEVGIQTMLEAIAFAPSAVYSRELGTQGVDGAYHLTSWEVADWLAQFLLESEPDQGLLDAARADQLTTAAGIDAQTERLLATPDAQQNLSQTLLSFLQAARIFDVVKDPKFGDFTSLQPAMWNETQLFVNDALWQNPIQVSQLLTSTRSFVNPALAELYGVAYPGTAGQSDFLPVTLPATERAGILTQASLLSIKSAPNTTSIIFRGLFVRGALLCLPDIPVPSDASTLAKINSLRSDGTLSERQKADFRKTTQPCGGCHAAFDPFGLALEEYDAIGRHRSVDEVGAPIDASIDATPFSPVLSGTVSGAVELAQRVAASGRFQHCLTSRVLSYAAGSPLEANDCAVREASQASATAGDTVRELARAIARTSLLSPRHEVAAGASQ